MLGGKDTILRLTLATAMGILSYLCQNFKMTITQSILDYCLNHSTDEPLILQELRRETWQKVLNPRMLSGPMQGRFLAMISKIKQPKYILEIGTYTGYATLCLAEGLLPGGKVITIDKNEELQSIQKKYFKKSTHFNKIIALSGNALDLIPQLEYKFDLVFIDAHKTEYIDYFKQVIDKIAKGGIILVDNVLWSGKVLEYENETDEDTRAIIDFNKYLKNHIQIENIILPIRDGISLAIKR